MWNPVVEFPRLVRTKSTRAPGQCRLASGELSQGESFCRISHIDMYSHAVRAWTKVKLTSLGLFISVQGKDRESLTARDIQKYRRSVFCLNRIYIPPEACGYGRVNASLRSASKNLLAFWACPGATTQATTCANSKNAQNERGDILHGTWLPETSIYIRRLAPDAEAPGSESIEGVSARVIPLRVGLAALGLLIHYCILLLARAWGVRSARPGASSQWPGVGGPNFNGPIAIEPRGSSPNFLWLKLGVVCRKN